MQKEQTIRVKAAAWTVGVHVLLLLMFILVSYTVPVTPPVEELGMEVNLGTSDEGYGTDQPMAIGAPAPDAASTSYRATAQEANTPANMMQSDDPDAPSIVTPVRSNNNLRTNDTRANESRNRNRQQQAASSNAPTTQRPRYVYPGGTGPGGNNAGTDIAGGNEGDRTGNGDRGVPGGTPGASNYEGSPGNGNGGISHTLGGRSIVAFPPRDADFRESGRVVVRVTVNRNGAIVNKQVVSASSAELRSIALRKIDKVRFNKSDEAPQEQFGNITFVFKTRS